MYRRPDVECATLGQDGILVLRGFGLGLGKGNAWRLPEVMTGLRSCG